MASKTEAKALRKFGIVDKLAYAAGDFGCNMSFGLKSYLTIFWTQFMGIDQVLMAGLLLLVQVWDAINDPIIGAMVDTDKHHYKRNKFLAYINVGGWGLLVGGAMCFIPWQGAPAMTKNILFVAGYIIWDAFYTVANVPYGSLLGMITDDPTGRAQLSTWRNVGACVAGILTGIILPYLIYDATNNMMGNRLFWIALILGGVGVVSFQYLVRKTVIRVDADVKVGEDAPKFNVLTACKNFMRNRAIVGITLAIVVGFIQFYGASTAMTVMFQSYFHNVQISGLLGYLSYVGIFLYVPFIGKITPKLGKKRALCCVPSVCAFPTVCCLFCLLHRMARALHCTPCAWCWGLLPVDTTIASTWPWYRMPLIMVNGNSASATRVPTMPCTLSSASWPRVYSPRRVFCWPPGWAMMPRWEPTSPWQLPAICDIW